MLAPSDPSPASRFMTRLAFLACCAAVVAALCACERKVQENKATSRPATLITTTQVKSGVFEVVEETLGTLEALADPSVAAEVSGQVLKVHARAGQAVRKGQLLAVIDERDIAIQLRAEEAEVKRLEALLAQQERLVQRQQNLVGRGFISQNALDDAIAQRNALRQQLAGARARSDAGRSSLSKTRVMAPIDGVIEVQIASDGDYVKIGDPLFKMVSNRRLRAHLPFPEAAAARMKPGLPVRIVSPLAPGKVIETTVEDVRPTVSESGRAIDVTVRFDNDGAFKGGGTVNAAIVVARKPEALTVPEQSVVLRPAGKVAYVIRAGKAEQRVVETGAKRDGVIEIVSGLSVGETVALDGAGFLSHDAAVSIHGADQPPARAEAAAGPNK